MNRFPALLLAVVFILSLSPTILWADEKAADTGKTTWKDIFSDVVGHYPLTAEQKSGEPAQKGGLNIPKNWVFDFGLQRFLMSHTSYKIGNDSPPFQQPLSQLEFPLNTWWLDFRLRRTCPRWSIGGRAGLSVERNTDGRMKDTDWENPQHTDMITTYSEGACRAEQNFLFRGDVDVNISDWLRLPSWVEIRPLFAVEYQRLNLMEHDSVQWSVGHYSSNEGLAALDGAPSISLPDNGIHLQEDYYLYQIGIRGSCDLLRPNKFLKLKAHGEADWGPDLGYYEDRHTTSPGERVAPGKSWGNSLYFETGLELVFANSFTAGIAMDYLQIRNYSGATRETNAPLHQDSSYWTNGCKVWSDQTSLTAHVSYAF